ncbi:hypothetical protein FACS189413_01750 [Bacteroidia bacterium]|nr:hypothetical protein FACS189413_01750 [Bacteroidia bacterium]
MKKFILFIVFGITCCTINAQNVAFLKTGGTNGNGKSPATPTTSINTAYKVLEDAGGGGTIVLVDGFTISSNFMRAVANTQNVTLTSVWDGVDYREGNPNCALTVGTAGFRYSMNGPHTFENITLKGNPSLTANYIMFIANFHPLTMGEGVSVVNFPNTIMTTSCSILSGIQQGGTGSPTATNLDANLTIKSGAFIIVGFNRQVTANYTGTAHIDIQGGEITAFYGGSIPAGSPLTGFGNGGNLDLTISGGSFKDAIYAGNRPYQTTNNAQGNTTVTITGGDFTACPAILGEMDGVSAIDVSALDATGFDFIKRRCYGFDQIKSTAGWEDFYIPSETFDSGSFISTTGIELPYRIYLPENYDAGNAYPLVLFMHDNGSRGADNSMQLRTIGAAVVSRILNSGNECIIVAPQCPTTTNWVADGQYPGNAGYTVDDVPMSDYLAAAKELLDDVIATQAVDLKRIYICGSSNGGGATWDLMSRFPNLFAAGVPMAGCGASPGAAAIAGALAQTPIWTFHGDADGTLPVAGTRGLVAAIEAAGGTKIQYTEFPGIDHGVWWVASATEGLTDWLFAQEKTLTAIENAVSQDNQVVATEYFNLQGVQIPVGALRATPLPTGVYIVKQTLKSGETRSQLIMYNF